MQPWREPATWHATIIGTALTDKLGDSAISNAKKELLSVDRLLAKKTGLLLKDNNFSRVCGICPPHAYSSCHLFEDHLLSTFYLFILGEDDDEEKNAQGF